MAVRFVVIGGGPAGTHAAITAARLGAEVTVVERDVFGGAANLWDCIPSKAMIATGGVMSVADRAPGMGLQTLTPSLDLPALKGRIKDIETGLSGAVSQLLESQGVRLIRGQATMKGPHEIVVETSGADGASGSTEEITAEAVLVSTGSRPASLSSLSLCSPNLRSAEAGCSRPATPTRRRRCPSTSWSSARE